MNLGKGKALMGLAAVLAASALSSGCELFGELLEEPEIVPVDVDPLPPISGGTLAVTRNGTMVPGLSVKVTSSPPTQATCTLSVAGS